jgi:hypothetical protein
LFGLYHITAYPLLLLLYVLVMILAMTRVTKKTCT